MSFVGNKSYLHVRVGILRILADTVCYRVHYNGVFSILLNI